MGNSCCSDGDNTRRYTNVNENFDFADIMARMGNMTEQEIERMRANLARGFQTHATETVIHQDPPFDPLSVQEIIDDPQPLQIVVEPVNRGIQLEVQELDRSAESLVYDDDEINDEISNSAVAESVVDNTPLPGAVQCDDED